MGDIFIAARLHAPLPQPMHLHCCLFHLPGRVLTRRTHGTYVLIACCGERERARSCTGLGMTLSMDWLPAPGATGSYDSDFDAKADAIVAAVTTGGYQFGFVHVKAVDDCGHDGLWRQRVRYIERMDALLLRIARALLAAEEVRIARGGANTAHSCRLFALVLLCSTV